MPQFDFPYPRRYNTLRLLGYEYNSPYQLCAVSLVTDLRRPLFADMKMAKSVLTCLLIAALMDWRATLRPEVVELKNWPNVKPGHFLKKRLWQKGLFDHVIRNDFDLQENVDYIAMNPVREGYVTRPQFYPYTGFLL